MYNVLESEIVDVYHYHGSWFEYLWKLKLECSETGEVKEVMGLTWDHYESLTGKQIELLDDGFFKVM